MSELLEQEINEQIKEKRKNLQTSVNGLRKKLEIPMQDKVLGMTFHKEIPVAERLMCKDIYMIKIQQESGEIYYLGINGKQAKILNMKQDGKIELAEDGKKVFEKMIGTEEKQTDAQKEIYDYDKDTYIEQNKEGQLEISDKEKKQNAIEQQKQQIVQTDDEKLESNDVMSIISITEPEQFASSLYKTVGKGAELFLVKYKNGKFKLWQKDKEKYSELMGWEISEFGQELYKELNLDPTRSGKDKINEYDFDEGKTERGFYRFAVIQNRTDSNHKVIIEYDQNGKASTSVYERDGIHALKELKTEEVYPEKIYINDIQTDVNLNPENKKMNSIIDDNRRLEILYELKIVDEDIKSLENVQSRSQDEDYEVSKNVGQEIDELKGRKRYLLYELGIDERTYNTERDTLEERINERDHFEDTRAERTMYSPPYGE